MQVSIMVTVCIRSGVHIFSSFCRFRPLTFNLPKLVNVHKCLEWVPKKYLDFTVQTVKSTVLYAGKTVFGFYMLVLNIA